MEPALLVQAPGTRTMSRAVSLTKQTRTRTAPWTLETWQLRRNAFCEVRVLLEEGRDCMAAEMQSTLRSEAGLLALLQ